MISRAALAVFCVVSSVAGASREGPPAEHADAPFEGFEDFVEKSMSDAGVPGLALAVVRGDEIVYLKGFGQRDVQNTVPVTPHTLFPIGSCGKAFTALAAGILVDEGKLNLDTPVAEYLPDFRLYDDYATLHATPRDLLCHRTGVPAYDMLWLTVPLSRDEYYRRLRYLQPSVGFREEFQYNSLMYIAAGVLVARLSSGTWEEYISNRIFEPLGMLDSNFSIVDSQRTSDFSLPYVAIGDKQMEIPFRDVDAVGPAGSINSSASDMAKWLLLHVGGGIVAGQRLVSEDSLAQTQRPHMVVSDPITTRVHQASLYGQGWFISRYRDHCLVEHPGGIDGFFALVSLLPDDDIGAVVLTNSLPNMLTYLISRNIFDRMLGLDIVDRGEQYTELLAYMKRAWGPPVQSAKPRLNTRPSLPLDAYTGTYEHPAFGPIRITLDKDQLSADHFGGTYRLEHFHYDVFKGHGSALAGKKLTGQSSALAGRRLQFHLDPAGNVESLSMRLEPSVGNIHFKRVWRDKKPERQAWKLETAPKGIDALEEITLGGAKQWILMRGENAANPILLFLHGGPGFAEMPYAHLCSARLEEHFVVVNWDQRGAGKSYDPIIAKETMNMEQFLSDTYELIQLLKARFSQDKIFLLGHSWGSVLGLYTAYRHPKDLHAYIGMGQVVNSRESETLSYRYTLEKALKAGDGEAIGRLGQLGSPPYDGGFQDVYAQRALLARFGGSVRGISYHDFEKMRNASPYYTEADEAHYMQAFMQTFALMWDYVMGVDFFEDVTELQIPVYFFTGRYDYQTPFELVERYMSVLTAPHKEIVWFEDSGHMPNLEEPELYQDKVVNVVLRNTPKK